MANMTLSISDKTKRRMEKHRHIKWSSAVRAIIEKRLDDLDEVEKLAQKSRLTQKDVDELTERVNADIRKHVKGLMDEGNG